MTNGDYIRQMMTDEYIALRFCVIASQFNGHCSGCDSCPLYENKNCESYGERLKWLKEEYAGEKEVETKTETNATRDLLSEIRNVLYIIKWYEGCDYDKYCISRGEGNIRDCIEGLQYVENELNKRKEEENGDL